MSGNHKNIDREIFFSHSANATERAIKNGGRFAYYTTAATAQLILKNKELWMRNTAVMNDYMEVEHGLNCLVQSYNSAVGSELKAAMDECFPGVAAELEALFNSWIPIIKKQTYILSVTEHAASDDAFGRLSMWRAYGGDAGIALVFNGGPMFRPSDALKAYSSPVAYLAANGVADELAKVTLGIRKNAGYVRSQSKKWLLSLMFEAFRFAAICTKHPSFSEEREWRVVSTQDLDQSERLKPICETIGNTPQLLLKLKLQDIPEEGLYGLSMPSFLDRILIGPCEHPETIKTALSSLLAECGISDPDNRIHITGVPLRQNQR